jgi:hypothetical protein
VELFLRRWTLSRGLGNIADRERLSSLGHRPLSFDSGPGFRVVARDSGRIGRALIRRYVGFVDRQGGKRCDRQHQRRGHTSGNYSPYLTQLFLALSETTTGTWTPPLYVWYVASVPSVHLTLRGPGPCELLRIPLPKLFEKSKWVPNRDSEGRQKGTKEARSAASCRQKRTIETPSAISQTVSPETI